jgi:hypothetical protein
MSKRPQGTKSKVGIIPAAKPVSKVAAGLSASDWYAQIMGKLPENSPKAPQEADEVSTEVKTGVLLSERTDIWSAVDDISSLKKGNKIRTKNNILRQNDAKIAKLEANDADGDDFFVGLMKNRTGDAFDDLAVQLEMEQEKQKVAQAAQTAQAAQAANQLAEKKTKKPLVVAKTVKIEPKKVKISPQIEESLPPLKKQKSSLSTTGNQIVQLPPPSSPPLSTKSKKIEKSPKLPKIKKSNKPFGWTPAHGKYYSDRSKIGTSNKFDDFHKSLPSWFMEPKYQIEVRQLVEKTNANKRYTPSPLSQWVVQQDESEEEEEEVESSEEESVGEEPMEEKTSKKQSQKAPIKSLLLLKQPQAPQLSDDDEDVEIDFEDVDEDFENDNTNFNSDSEMDASSSDQELPSTPTTPTIPTSSTIRAFPAPISHQLLILNNTEDRTEALREIHDRFTNDEKHSRMKTKMLIIVRDGRVANQLICKIGLRVTKHRKNNRGMSNAGLVVSTKGVDMLHERLNDVQRRKAFEKFQKGSVQTLILTDQFLSMTWPCRQQIGCIVHYDIPHQNKDAGIKKGPQKGKISHREDGLTKEEVEKQRQSDLRFSEYHTISTMQERLSYLQRLQTAFPDEYYVKQNGERVHNVEKPFRNISLVFLTPTYSSQAFAKNMINVYQGEYNAVKSSEALAEFAKKTPTQ